MNKDTFPLPLSRKYIQVLVCLVFPCYTKKFTPFHRNKKLEVECDIDLSK